MSPAAWLGPWGLAVSFLSWAWGGGGADAEGRRWRV